MIKFRLRIMKTKMLKDNSEVTQEKKLVRRERLTSLLTPISIKEID